VKLLLAETGTLEQTLSILSNSEIQVSVSEQKEEGKLIHRDALILRKKTGETLVTAKSRFFVANLPSVMVRQLRKRNLGIGSIITRNQIETFRKIVKIGYNSNSSSVFRYYKIIHHGKVAIEIKEHFSVDIGSKLGLSF
jgi:chorismate-pyruvate lyase